MAINRQDYQYIRNTLPSKANSIEARESGSSTFMLRRGLNIGDAVSNLAESVLQQTIQLEVGNYYVLQIINLPSTSKVMINNIEIGEYAYIYAKNSSMLSIVIDKFDENIDTQIILFKSNQTWVVDQSECVVNLIPSKVTII